MPHIIIKLWPGKTGEQKEELVKKFKSAMNETLIVPEKAITVAFDEINPENWYEDIHIPLIEGNVSKDMFIPEGYKPFKK